MANPLDERTGPFNSEGRDTYVIDKQLPVEVGIGSTIFEICLWLVGLIPATICLLSKTPILYAVIAMLAGVIPGLIFLFKKTAAKNYFSQLEQKLQHDRSQIENYLEQRVIILQNCAKLLDKAIDLDKTTYSSIAAYRSGKTINSDESLNDYATNIDSLSRSINIALEQYPNLEAHRTIEDAMQQNSYLQREITAAREIYNDTINAWNRDIYIWPTKMIVAARNHYTTKVPFHISSEVREQARNTFF